ncbi:MAG: ABC transporter permease [Anaerolineales bacterium]|nr:ABC transporter permease [Anaerolineales bacterium]
MIRYLVQRVLVSMLTIFLVIVLTFIIMHATPGGPWDIEVAQNTVSIEILENLEHAYGLDKPLFFNKEAFNRSRSTSANPIDWVLAFLDGQFENYFWGLLHGNLGPSFRLLGVDVQDVMFAPEEGRPIWTSRFGETVLIGVLGLIINVGIGVPLGIVAALKRNTIIDYASLGLVTIVYGIPSFALAIFLILIFSVGLGLLPVITPSMWVARTNLPNWKAAFMPALAIGLPSAAFMTRLTRTSILEVANLDFIRTARAKGLGEKLVVGRHIFRNALIPIVTVMGPQLAWMVTGSFIVETIFGINGVGRLLVESIGQRDYTMIMATTELYAVIIVFMNMFVDILYGVLDPRLRITN